MNADALRSFCPHCQADWDQPWYDVCPACGHNFKGRPWWQPPWLALGLIVLPAFLMLACALIPQSLLAIAGFNDREEFNGLLALGGSVVTALPAGILLACRLDVSMAARVLLSLVFIPVIWIVSVCLCFFACGLTRT